PVDPAGDPLVQFGPGHVDADLDGVVDRVVAGEVGGERPAGDLDHFQGADDPASVARQDGPGGRRVGGGEPGVQGAGAPQRELLLQAGAHVGVGPGELEVVDGTADVEAGAAHQDRPAALGEQGVDPLPREPLVLGDGGGDGHVPDVQEVVRHPAALLGRQFGGADVHPSVELHRVGVDDLTSEALRQENTQIGLSGRSGADDGDDAGGGGCAAH